MRTWSQEGRPHADGAGRRPRADDGPGDRAESTIDGADLDHVPGRTGDDVLTPARSDAELVAAVREGDQQAFAALYERHAPAARAVARRYSNSAADADDAVADGFARILAAVRAGHGPDAAFRAYLFTVVRRVALERVDQGRRVEPTDDVAALESGGVPAEPSDEPTMAGFERDVVAQAYRSLPERWQAVLWYTEVEGLGPAQTAPALGIPANAVAVLAYRAREGLRQAYLQQHVAAPVGDGCARIAPRLGAYVRGSAGARDTAAVSAHLTECAGCRGLVLELGEVSHAMRAVIAPLVLGAAAVTAIQGVGLGGAAALGGSAAAAGVGIGAAAPAGIGAAAPAGIGAAAPAGIGAAAPAGVGAAAAAPAGITAVPLAAAGGASTAAVGAAGAGTTAVVGAVGAGSGVGTVAAVGTGVGAAAAGGTGVGVAAGVVAAGGTAAGWSSLAAGASMGALKLGTSALVAAAVGVVPALGPLPLTSVGEDASVLSVVAPASSGPAVLPGELDPGEPTGDPERATRGGTSMTDPAAVVLPHLATAGLGGHLAGGRPPTGDPASGDAPDSLAPMAAGTAPGTNGPGRVVGGSGEGTAGPGDDRRGGQGASGPGSPAGDAPRGDGSPAGGPPEPAAPAGDVPPGHGPTGDGPPGHVPDVGAPGTGVAGGHGAHGNGTGADGASPNGNGPHGDGPPGHAAPVGDPAVVDAPAVQVPRGQGPGGDGPPGHATTVDVPGAGNHGAPDAPGAGSAAHGRGPHGDGPPGHRAP